MFCIGCIIRVVYECRVRGNTQAKIVSRFLQSIDSKCEEISNEAASHIIQGVKNPSIYVKDVIADYSSDSYPNLVAFFRNNIVNLIKENDRNHVRDALILMIQEDPEIEEDTIVELISKIKKRDLSNKADDLDTFLAGTFLYALKNTTNKTGGKVKDFAQEYLKRVREGAKPINTGHNVNATEEEANLKQEMPMSGSTNREIDLIKESIESEAAVFCMNYEDKRDYIALCQIVSFTNPLKKHYRKMYNDFCLSKKSVRNRILELNEVKVINIYEKDWWEGYIALFLNDYKEYGLGDDKYAYSIGQYFPRLLNYGDAPVEQYLQYYIRPQVETPLMKSLPNFKYDISGFINEYMRSRKLEKYKDDLEPPMDFLWRELNFAECDELTLSASLALFIIGACSSMPLKNEDKNGFLVYSGPGLHELETAEDLFYMTLLTLYETYGN